MGWGPRKRNPLFDVLAFRRRMGMTQLQLAQFLPVATMSINRWERHGVKPLPWCVKKMLQLERSKLAGVRREPQGAVPPYVKRALPPVSIKTGNPATIGIVPSGF